MSTANEQPGSGLPEEPVESVEPGEPGESIETAEDVGAVAAGSGAGLEAVTGAETGSGSGSENDSGSETASETASETEEERIARERAEFDKLVAAFHSESAPDPQLRHPDPEAGPAAPRKIIRYPVLDPHRTWDTEIVEPTDETTSDPLDYIEHYEPPDPDLPQASAATIASWTMLIGGVLFLVLRTLLQWQTPDYLGWLAIIGVFGGIVSLVARMKPDRDDYDDPDNGAVV
ncbi:MAG: hypothetical protein JF587_01855 [Catenulisporales bacterium]|nr:hypothetical protein [Catenulisporales bacterium]